MPNLYEFLKIASGASTTEVQAAWDELYNQSRRLVTHHDPQIVQEANQSLLHLEQARAALLDPMKRANYDATLGVGTVGGIFDPNAQSQGQGASFAVQRIVPSNAPQSGMISQPVSGGWFCPKCHTTSPMGTKFCKKCGQVLGKDCPKCRTLLETGAPFCTVCGVNIGDFERQQEIERSEQERQRILSERMMAQRQAVLGPIIKNADESFSHAKTGCILYFIPILTLASIPLWIMAIYKANKVLKSSQVQGDTEYRERAKSALKWAAIPLTIVSVLLASYILLTILQVVLIGVAGGRNGY